MESRLSFDGLVRRTGFRIIRDFILAILILYIMPMMFVSVESFGEVGERIAAVFFNIFSWIYLCLALIWIIGYHSKKMLRLIKKEMDMVYHNSMWLEPQPKDNSFYLHEFAHTNTRIAEMQKRIQDMIIDEKKQKEELIFKVSAASHDLKTPLTVIQGNADLLLYSKLDAEQEQCLEYIMVACTKLKDYFNALINYSNTFYEDKSAWKSLLVEEVIDIIRHEATFFLKNEAKFELVDETKAGSSICLNLNYLLRAIVNLLSNAKEYTKAKEPEIKITVKNMDDMLVFSIWNEGSCFSNELIEQGVKLFYRDNKERNFNQSHFGIGLAFAKRVAELQEGELKISNQNNGATVDLKLKMTTAATFK